MSHLSALKGIDSPLSKSDHFFTPGDLFDALHAEFRFTLDPCNHPESNTFRKVQRSHCWPDEDGLIAPWDGHRVFMNNPYSQNARWVRKAHEEITARRGCRLVVGLLQACKTEQPWWQKFIEPFRDRLPEQGAPFWMQTRFIAKRQEFGMPAAVKAAMDAERRAKGKKPLSGSGTFASVLIIWRAL